MNLEQLAGAVKQGQTSGLTLDGGKIYSASLARHESDQFLMLKLNGRKSLLVVGNGALYQELQGEEGSGYKLCPLTHENRLALNRRLPYTRPQAFGTQVATMGLGDRLGLASPGHIRTLAGHDIRPILAQQSIRELKLTNRTYEEVLDAAAYGVIQEGYTGGYGADGDHLKQEDEIKMSLDLGFSMLTLDCSEKIDNTIDGMSEADIRAKYAKLDGAVRTRYEARYLNRSFDCRGHAIAFDSLKVMTNALIYGEAIRYMIHIYETYIKNLDRPVDFEISIDETLTPTAPHAHYFVASELKDADVEIFSMAPRFCGEFQKGIDYIGDLAQFEEELVLHAAIADHFGYKLSIHSGSDKFSVFPFIGKYTGGRFHLKTAGTNWLEAVRTVAKVDPELYRRMHRYALEHFQEAAAYYHVTTDIAKIKPLEEVADAELPTYLDEDNARQLLHITYGLLLTAKDKDGGSLFKDAFYRVLNEREDDYDQALIRHIGKHLQLLGK